MSNETDKTNKADKWFADGEWTNGLHVKVDRSVNVETFFSQYNLNRKYWDKAFAYLRDTDLEHTEPGKYLLDGNHVYALVSEGNTKAIRDTKWEAHIKYIDIQYVIKGKEKIGVAPLSKATIIPPFNSEKDIGFYDLPESDGIYYEAQPDIFFIFFPQDLHRPGIIAGETGTVKKLVIKIEVG